MSEDSISYKLTLHLITKDQQEVDTHFTDAQGSLTLDECLTIVQEDLKKPLRNFELKARTGSQPLSKDLTVQEFTKKGYDELLVFYEPIAPIIKEAQKKIEYQSLTKYSFLDQKKFCKVYVPLEGVGELPAENIHKVFLDRSLSIKIHGLKGKNYIFAVPMTQCQIAVKESKLVQKSDKLIIYIGKVAQLDNWFSLHKTKLIGEKEN